MEPATTLAATVAEGLRGAESPVRQWTAPSSSGLRRRTRSSCLRTEQRRLQILVNEGDGHAALADRGRHALHRAVAHVPAGEDPRHAGLEEVGIPGARPVSSLGEVGTGENKPPHARRCTSPVAQSRTSISAR